MKKTLTIAFLAFICFAFAQSPVSDSLLKKLEQAKHDSVRARLYWHLVIEEENDSLWLQYNLRLLSLAEKCNKSFGAKTKANRFLRYLGSAYNNIADHFHQLGKIDSSLLFHKRSMDISLELKDVNGAAISQSNMASIFSDLGEEKKAIENYFAALSLMEKDVGKDGKPVNPEGLGTTLNNIGILYIDYEEYKEALNCFNRSFKWRLVAKDTAGMATTYTNIGYVYYRAGDIDCSLANKQLCKERGYDKALNYYAQAMRLRKQLGDEHGEGVLLNNFGNVFFARGANDSAEVYYRRSYAIREKLAYKDEQANTLKNLGKVLLAMKKLSEAEQCARLSFKMAQELLYPSVIQASSKLLYEIYREKGDFKRAFNMYELHINLRDSLEKMSSLKELTKKSLQYEYGKKATADSVKIEEEKKLSAAQLKQEKTQRYALYGGIILGLIFALFMVNRFVVASKQKKIIEEQKHIAERQKHLVEEKQREILDSIRYAKRIQTALITSEFYIKRELKRLGKRG